MFSKVSSIILLQLFFTSIFYSQNCNNLDADAGQDVEICIGENIQIGGNPTGEWSGGGNPTITYLFW